MNILNKKQTALKSIYDFGVALYMIELFAH